MTAVDDAHTALPVTGVEPEAKEPDRRRRRRVWLALGGAAIVAAGAGAWLWTGNSSTESSPAATRPAATAVVERGTISATESWTGTLDHGTPFTVSTGGAGTITRLVDQGQTVERNDELYRVDEQPVTLLSGAVPMFRDLGPGDSGVDVWQLEANLAALGYGGFAVDDRYTGSTAAAVRLWQESLGVEPTGMVARSDVVFVPESGQVDALRANVGDVVGPGAAVLDITGTGQVVSVEVDVDDRDRFDVGTQVTAVLPGGDEVAGTISTTAVVQAAPGGADAGPGGGGDTEAGSIVQVEVALFEEVPEEFVGASVDVIVPIDERADVLLVPVNALLALAEGGFGLEVVANDGSTSIVTVETGLFGEGRVEVTSAEIGEGTVVGVAGR